MHIENISKLKGRIPGRCMNKALYYHTDKTVTAVAIVRFIYLIFI